MNIPKDDIITTDGYLDFCKKNKISYAKTDFFYKGAFNWRGEPHPIEFGNICVIGHSDYPVTDAISARFEKVFCINKIGSNPNTFGIPLGITNIGEDSDIHRIYGNRDIMIDVMNMDIEKSHLVYLNFNTYTHCDRPLVSNLFSDKEWTYLGNIENTLEGRKRFLIDIKSSKFVFCPRGNGIDTHRLWETLYMGSYPIVKYENAHQLFTDLPILFIKDWNDIDEDFLNRKYEEFNNTNWNLDKLKLSYWLDFIKKTSF
jgi:hypothetical protein